MTERYGPDAYEFGTSMITVTIPFAKNSFNNNQNVSENVGENVGVKLTKSERMVLDEIKNNQFTGADNISKKINVTKRTVERSLKSLKEKGVIERIGPDKGGHWEIKK